IENCRNVVVSNVFVLGTAVNPQLHTYNCGRVYFNRCEVSGLDFGHGPAGAGGIVIENTVAPRFPVWSTIENCYVGPHVYVPPGKYTYVANNVTPQGIEFW